MKVQIDPHTLQRANERGASKHEILETLESGINILAKSGRLGKSKVFKFESVRNKKFYDEKKVEVYYLLENDIIITVTVYVFYGKF
jgi:hypothetical protein